jgi:hypothetical protein
VAAASKLLHSNLVPKPNCLKSQATAITNRDQSDKKVFFLLLAMAGAVDLPKLPEGQESYAGIPKAVFVVSEQSYFARKSLKIGIFYNQQSFLIRMIFTLHFSQLMIVSIAG